MDKEKAECDIRTYFKIRKCGGMQAIKRNVLDSKVISRIDDSKERMTYASNVERDAIKLADNVKVKYFERVFKPIDHLFNSLTPIEQESLMLTYGYEGYRRNGRESDKEVAEKLNISIDVVKEIRKEFCKEVAYSMGYFDVNMIAN